MVIDITVKGRGGGGGGGVSGPGGGGGGRGGGRLGGDVRVYCLEVPEPVA